MLRGSAREEEEVTGSVSESLVVEDEGFSRGGAASTLVNRHRRAAVQSEDRVAIFVSMFEERKWSQWRLTQLYR